MNRLPTHTPELLSLAPDTISDLIGNITEQTSRDSIRQLITQVSTTFWNESFQYDDEQLILLWEKLLSVAPAEPAFNTSISFMLMDLGEKPKMLTDELNKRRLAAIQSYRQRLVQRATPPPAVQLAPGKSSEEMICEMLNMKEDVVEIADFKNTLFSYFRLRGPQFSLLPGWQRAAIILLGKVRKRADFESIMNDQRNRSVINPIFNDWDNFPFEDFVASFPKPLQPFEYNWIYSRLTPEFSPDVSDSQKHKRKPLWDYLEEYKDKIVYDGSGSDMSNGTSWYPDKFWRDEQIN